MSDRDQRVLATAAAVGAEAETLDSPSVPEGLGRALTERLRDFAPDIVAFWVSPDAAVLAHVVARELGVSVIGVREDQGRIILGRSPAPGAKVVVVDVDWGDSLGLLPLIHTFAGAARLDHRPIARLEELLPADVHSLDEVTDVHQALLLESLHNRRIEVAEYSPAIEERRFAARLRRLNAKE